MELKEHEDCDEESYLHQQADCHDYEVGVEDHLPMEVKKLLDEHGQAKSHAGNQRQDDVEQKQDEEFSVSVAYAIAYPRTMMIHVENTPLARRAVVASTLKFQSLPFWFETMAQQTIPSATIVSFLSEEAPIDGYSSWVCDYRVDHGPE